jgi:hypothetical protein
VGLSYSEICRELRCNCSYISRGKKRFLSEGLAGLYARHRGRAVEKRTPARQAKILEWTPPDTVTAGKLNHKTDRAACPQSASRVSFHIGGGVPDLPGDSRTPRGRSWGGDTLT